MSFRSPSRPIVLASASPRRREMLERIGMVIEVRPADVDETPRAGEAPLDYVRRVARDKAEAIASDAPVLAADTIVEIDGEILGKAADDDEARAMLAKLRGRTHRVTTAFALRAGGAVRVETVTSEVVMADFGDDDLEDYVACGEWRGKAGAYAVQGIAAALVAEVRGSITNVIGLPLYEVVSALEAAGITPAFTAGKPA
jgi:septum formation protein